MQHQYDQLFIYLFVHLFIIELYTKYKIAYRIGGDSVSVCGDLGIPADGTSHSDGASVPVVAALPARQLQHRQQSQWKRQTVSEYGQNLQ